MATPNPGEPPINAPVTDDKGNMTVPWHLWCVMMWKKIGGGGSLTAAWGSITGLLSSQTDLQAALNSKQASLGFTPENVANKTIDGTLGSNSDILYPSEKAVKTYVDGHAASAPSGTGFPHVTSGAYDPAAVGETGTGSVVRASAPTLANPVVGTQTSSDNSTLAASTAFVKAQGYITSFLLAVRKAGTLIGSRAALNFIEGSNVTLTVADNSGTGAVDVTIAASAGGSGTVTHTGALDAHKVVIGNGTDDVKVIATGSAGQYVRSGGASADPAMASIAESEVTNLVSDLALKADLASPTFTGTPAAPTPTTADNSTKIATTAYVQAQGYVTSGGGGSALASGPYLKLSSVYYIGPAMHACSLPDTSLTGFAWTNQSTCTAAAQSGALLITDPSGSTNVQHMLTKSIGASTKLIVAFIPTFIGSSGSQTMGLVFYESGTGKSEQLDVVARTVSANAFMDVTRWTSSGTVFNSTQITFCLPLPTIVYLKLEVSGSNLVYSYSADGTNYTVIRTVAKTSAFTTAPDKWGFVTDSSTLGTQYMLVLSWEES